MKLVNAGQGKRFFGMHFYPGVAEYQDPNVNEGKPWRVYLNSNTIRQMDESFEGRPIFVLHVDEVETDLDELRREADGWVVRSFYNAADGKHWAEMVIVSERGLAAIERGYRLSNCYNPRKFGPGGEWNAVKYDREVLAGEYEHMALVTNPRYDESTVLTPEGFRVYNDNLNTELRLANDNQKGDRTVALKLFKKKVENATVDLETLVELPKSGKEVSLLKCINAMDNAMAADCMANGDHMVEYGGHKMTVNEFVKKHGEMANELDALKKKSGAGEDAEREDDGDTDEDAGLAEEVEPEEVDNAEDDDVENAEDDTDEDEVENDDGDYVPADEPASIAGVNAKKKNAKEAPSATKVKNAKAAADAAAAAKKAKDKEKAARLRNANRNPIDPLDVVQIETSQDQVARGKSRYGS